MVSDDHMNDDAAWDSIVGYCLRTAAALGISVLVFVEFVVMDVHWHKASLVSAIVGACLLAGIGSWTLRKLVLVTTVYAVGYLVGALPEPQAIGAFLGRMMA